MKKRLIITGSVILAVLLIIMGVVFGIRTVRNKGLIAEVENVGMLNFGYWGDSLESDGIVINNASQNVYPESGQIVNEVFVQEGQKVLKGDKLMSFDITSLELSAEIKKLDIQSLQNQYNTAVKKLDELKRTRPVSRQPVAQEPEEVITPESVITEEPASETPEPLPEKKSNGLYNYLDASCEPDEKIPAETEKKEVWQYRCSPDLFVLGSFLNEITNTDREYVFQVTEEDGEIKASLTVNGKWFSGEYDEELRWYPFDPNAGYDEEEIPEEEMPNTADFEENSYDEPQYMPEDSYAEQDGYTASELAAAIREKEQEIRRLDISIRTAKLQLEILEKQLKDGVVYAQIDGVVQKVSDPLDPPVDGSAFLEISGSEGMYVKGVISELKRGEISVGQGVQCMDYESGNTIHATIQEIDDYPSEDLYFYGSNNPNSSMYGYTAYVEDTSKLTGGQYLSLTIETESSEAVYLDKGYVRTEGGKSYVLKDEDGYLVKQYVTTGKNLWGFAVEILSGIQEDDYIAFPYGPAAKEGIKTSLAE